MIAPPRSLPRRAFLAALLLLASCGIAEPGQDEGGPVRIRVSNASRYTLEAVSVGFPEVTQRYGNLAPGETSGYHSIPRAHSYAFVEALAGGTRVFQQPIDYMGEPYLEPGSYTYQLTLASPTEPYSLRTTLRRD